MFSGDAGPDVSGTSGMLAGAAVRSLFLPMVVDSATTHWHFFIPEGNLDC
jgi:hypothetical protein